MEIPKDLSFGYNPILPDEVFFEERGDVRLPQFRPRSTQDRSTKEIN